MWILIVSGFAALLLAHTAPFPFLLEFLGPGRSVWHMPAADGAPTIYFTYDDGPNPTATPALLDALAEQHVSATFFVIPRHINALTAPIVTRMFEEGHGVALHAHTRTLMLRQPDEFARLLAEQASDLERLTGRTPCRLFSPTRRLARRGDVPGARPGGVHACWLDLRHVGLELVATGTARTAGSAAGRARVGRRHRCHARWAS